MIAGKKCKYLLMFFSFVNITSEFLVAFLLHHQQSNNTTKNYLLKLDQPLILRSKFRNILQTVSYY